MASQVRRRRCVFCNQTYEDLQGHLVQCLERQKYEYSQTVSDHSVESSGITEKSLSQSFYGLLRQSQTTEWIDPNGNNALESIFKIVGNQLYASANQHSESGVAYGGEIVTAGRHRWRIKVLKKVSGAFPIIIGISSTTNKETGFHYGFASDGRKWINGHKSQYTDLIISEKDIISVELDLIDNTLSYSKNGKTLGIACYNIKRKAYRLAIWCSLSNTKKRWNKQMRFQRIDYEDITPREHLIAENNRLKVLFVDLHHFMVTSLELYISVIFTQQITP